MIIQTIVGLISLITTTILPVSQAPRELLSPIPEIREEVLAEHRLDLTTRNESPYTNEIFAYNILLALDYFCRFSGSSISDGVSMLSTRRESSDLDTDTMCRVSGDYSFTLEPGEIFAFHENVAPEFTNLPLKTGWTEYTAAEGYKTVGGLPGNGVCHLASLMNWTAQDAGLEVVAEVNHNFVPVPGVPKEYGTSIRYYPNGGGNTQNQNLYIINSFDFPVSFLFTASEQLVSLKLLK